MQVLYYYPIFLALTGFFVSAILNERALTLLSAEAKAALIDSSSRTRMLTLLILGLFLVLIFWHPVYAWLFLGCGYLGLGARSLPRLRRLGLPPPAARLILIGNITGVAGITLCAFIFALRTLH
jgi:hypothetical protein